MTIKGLEPEIERILKNSRDKIREIKINQKEAVAKQMAVIELQLEEKLNQEKLKCNQKTDETIQSERDYFNEKMKREVDRIE